jgi:BirA family transcriptional regulator, biotin operon repressor / biotin---[acetyl-CoA-carboxylase] ligase
MIDTRGAEPIPADLAAAIDEPTRRRVRFFTSLGSTNDAALTLAQHGAPEGTVVVADMQRAGRGRLGRQWFSPPGAGLYVSVVRRPASHEWTLMTLAAGVAAARAVLAATGLPVERKWPNDVVIGRPWRKLGGVLCESLSAGGDADAVVVGIGLNVRTTTLPPELASSATSIEAELGRPVERGPLLSALLHEVDAVLGDLRAGRRGAVRDAWKKLGAAGLAGAAVRWHDEDTVLTGHARDIDEDGALIATSGARSTRIVSGEVIWERLSRG